MSSADNHNKPSVRFLPLGELFRPIEANQRSKSNELAIGNLIRFKFGFDWIWALVWLLCCVVLHCVALCCVGGKAKILLVSREQQARFRPFIASGSISLDFIGSHWISLDSDGFGCNFTGFRCNCKRFQASASNSESRTVARLLGLGIAGDRAALKGCKRAGCNALAPKLSSKPF